MKYRNCAIHKKIQDSMYSMLDKIAMRFNLSIAEVFELLANGNLTDSAKDDFISILV